MFGAEMCASGNMCNPVCLIRWPLSSLTPLSGEHLLMVVFGGWSVETPQTTCLGTKSLQLGPLSLNMHGYWQSVKISLLKVSELEMRQ